MSIYQVVTHAEFDNPVVGLHDRLYSAFTFTTNSDKAGWRVHRELQRRQIAASSPELLLKCWRFIDTIEAKNERSHEPRRLDAVPALDIPTTTEKASLINVPD